MSLVHAEYLKLSRRKFYPILLVILVALILLLAFIFIGLPSLFPDQADDIPFLSKRDTFVFGAQQVAGQTWFPLIVATVVLGGDMASTVWATSLTRESSLVRHMGARLLVFVLASWAAFMVVTGAWALITQIWAEGSGGLTAVEWLGIAWRLGVSVLVWTVLGMAAVALLRQVGLAIGIVLAFAFIEPLFGLWGVYSKVSLTAATNGLFGVFFEGIFGDFVPGQGMSLAHALGVISGWIALALALTWVGLRYRDA